MKPWPDDKPTIPTPEPVAELPSPEAILAPLARWLGANFRLVKRKDVAPEATRYDGYQIAIDTCDDGEQLFDDEHMKLRVARSLPFTTAPEVMLLVAFQLGSEFQRRASKSRALGSSTTSRPRRANKPRGNPDGRFY